MPVEQLQSVVNHEQLWLGETISKFTMPKPLIDDINKAYDEHLEKLPPFNKQLVGKINQEHLVNQILTEPMKEIFKQCFREYLIKCGSELSSKPHTLELEPLQCWINEMKAGEYNPAHFHTGFSTLIGLSSVLFLKTPDTYGEEYSREEYPTNGRLAFIGGVSHPLGVSQHSVFGEVGDFYVFPYTLVHTVYPFNGTDQVRRTLSYNCDIKYKQKEKNDRR